tara:strand:- start:1356 stop:1613 length:258 start_codon:yes stop_codon:yes gene_type:complete
MEKENSLSIPSHIVGPFGAAMESADLFMSGMIYCKLLDNMCKEQLKLDEVRANAKSVIEKTDADITQADFNQAWSQLADILGYDC